MSSPASEAELADQLFARHDAVRYVAVLDGSQLTLRERAGLTDASASESDRYEELLVNPTLLTLASSGAG